MILVLAGTATAQEAEQVAEVRAAAERGDATAQFQLGLWYDLGRGVVRDDPEAVRWYRRAAEQGDAVAQNNLGHVYFSGEGVPPDEAEAVRWFRLTATQGYAPAQLNLTAMYANGDGVAQDLSRAYMWLDLAVAAASSEQWPRWVGYRFQVIERLTADQRASAKAQGATCLASDFQDCGEPD